jgi:hypothetical protein
MDNRSSRPPELTVAALVLAALVAVLSSMPPGWSMIVAVFAAFGWCFWLDRHPAA